MPYAVELYLDDSSSKKINDIRNKLQSNNITIDEGTDPHISLAIYEDIPVERFSNELRTFAKKIKPFNINLSYIGFFALEKPVVFLAPKVTNKLLNVHENFHNDFKQYKEFAWNYYLPNQWIPHCTLCMNLSEDMFKRAATFLKSISLPIEARFEKIGILKFKPNEQLIKYKLK